MAIILSGSLTPIDFIPSSSLTDSLSTLLFLLFCIVSLYFIAPPLLLLCKLFLFALSFVYAIIVVTIVAPIYYYCICNYNNVAKGHYDIILRFFSNCHTYTFPSAALSYFSSLILSKWTGSHFIFLSVDKVRVLCWPNSN